MDGPNLIAMADEHHIVAYKTAEALLQINAIKLNPARPFVWASGLRSPIYCDNRQILSHPGIRTQVARQLAGLSEGHFPQAQVVAGVATGAIAHGVLVAELLKKPFVYVRSVSKSHGLANRIEGRLPAGTKVVVVEDLVSTGKSSMEAVHALREAGAVVLGMVAIFTYELPEALAQLASNDCPLYSLSNYTSLLQVAEMEKRISPEEKEVLREWKKDPWKWSQQH
jgi:orotate phosphoribosyltransferase